MTDYPLARAQSLSVVRSRSAEPRPSPLARTYSVQDLGQHKPHWHSIYSYTPYNWSRDYDLLDDYWYDRNNYYSPLYRSNMYPRYRHSYSHYLPNSSNWSPYSNYWNRYKGNWYDYDYLSHYRPYYFSAYDRYVRYTYTPYRSSLLDSMSSSLAKGLSMYRAGTIDYGTLNNHWLNAGSWDRRFKDWRELYYTYNDPSGKNTIPSYYERRVREYMTSRYKK